MTTMETKALIIHSGEYQCMVKVSATDTLADLRPKLLEEFDEDMLPSTDNEDLYLCMGGIRLSGKQESKMLAWDVVVAGSSLVLHAKSHKRGVPEEDEKQNRSAKRARCNDEISTTEYKHPEKENAATAANVQEPKDFSLKNGQLRSEDANKRADEPAIAPEETTTNNENMKGLPSPLDKTSNEETEDFTIVGSEVGMATKENPNDSTGDVFDKDEELQILQMEEAKENRHEKFDKALSQSCDTLKQLEQLLKKPEHALFCSEKRRLDWSTEITDILKKSAPDTIIGCLGGTGVGKSSLLNALLDETAVLPTSGSRGCTAAVVELRFNQGLLETKDRQELDVYKGQVQFMSLQDWHQELEILIGECITHDTQQVYERPPDAQRKPDAAAAWAKIDQVYGRDTMRSMCGKAKSYAWDQLSEDSRVVQLLTPQAGSQSNTVVVKEGKIDATKSKTLLRPLSSLTGRLRRSQKKWAKGFREKINDYVYRKGKDGDRQTWPLIRKVVLHGPWTVLSTGACLVDLPGVRDANATRARVAQSYLQCCNKIWVVAPIKRAVDDGDARELMGEQFKRRLLMDGNYGNVSFICTQTDDCETTEIMRDHQDIAEQVQGRWEIMNNLSDQIAAIDKERLRLVNEEDDLKEDLEEKNQKAQDLRDEITEIETGMDGDDSEKKEGESDDAHILKDLRASFKEKEKLSSDAVSKLHDWRKENCGKVKKLEDRSAVIQRRLKAMCAVVRNEYSTKCLQEDFRMGLEELTRHPDEEELDLRQRSSTAATTISDESTPPLLPDDFQLEVHCISSNDYLKIQGVKPASDGPPNTFSDVNDTQIPALRAAVHKTTAQCRAQFAENFCSITSDLIDRVNLCAAESRENSTGGFRLKRAFDSEMRSLNSKLGPIVNEFILKAEMKVHMTLKPSLMQGAINGNHAAMATVTSWGFKNHRTRQQRSPEQNGLFWRTYYATVRRNGVYVSDTAGEIDFNQELCDPCEEAFSADWQSTMDGAIRGYLAESELKLNDIFAAVAQCVVTAFAQAGMDAPRLQAMANTANRTCTTALKMEFARMRVIAQESQRELNRSLLPKVMQRMEAGYEAAENAERGHGQFARMKHALENHARHTLHNMFDEAIAELLKSIGAMVNQIASMILGTGQIINQSLSSVYSVCWDTQQSKLTLVDPGMQQKVRSCRDNLLPSIKRLRVKQDETMDFIGIEREEIEFNVVGVDSWEERKAKEMKEAEMTGNFIDFCDNDDKNSIVDPVFSPTPPIFHYPVKSEPGESNASFRFVSPFGTQRGTT